MTTKDWIERYINLECKLSGAEEDIELKDFLIVCFELYDKGISKDDLKPLLSYASRNERCVATSKKNQKPEDGMYSYPGNSE
jgi:hypothetical protein|tara:strand:- start:321 stop:566 length:246 start_codon:yes stop_codon:yes gene_type:complete